MGILAHVLLFPYYVFVGVYALAAACVTAGCLGALTMLLLRDTGADILNRRPAAGAG